MSSSQPEPVPAGGAARCPVCATPVVDAPRRCERCDTPHHPECWEYLGGCGIFGCSRERASRSRESSLPSSLLPSSSSSSSPFPSPSHLLFHVADLADAVRGQSRALSLIAKGLLTAFFLPMVAFLGGLSLSLVVALVTPSYEMGIWSVVETLGTPVMTVLFGGGLIAALWGFGLYVVASLCGHRAQTMVIQSLGTVPFMGGRDRGLVLARLDLDEGDRAMVAAGGCAARLAWAFGIMGAFVGFQILVVVGQESGGMNLPVMAWLDLGPYGNGLLMVVISLAFTVAALRRLAALRLVDLQVTLNRIEAAGKGPT